MENIGQNRHNLIISEAVKYESLGFSVIPLGKITKNDKGKKDIVYPISWKKYETTRSTPEEIKTWHYENLGVVTGQVSGILVLDTDSYKENFDTELIKSFDLPITPVQQTASGGKQYFFKHPKTIVIKNAVCIGSKDSGIDIRGDGGMVICPPSTTPYGDYTWLISPFDEPLADIPPKLLELLKQGSGESGKARKELSELVGLNEGEGRNNAMTSLIGKLLLTTHPDKWNDEIWSMAQQVNNTYKPPMEISELRGIYESVTKIEGRQRSGLVAQEQKIEKKEIVRWGVFSKKEFPELRWRIKNLIPMEGFVIISAISGEKKSWVGLDMAKCIARGIDFLGTDKFKTKKGTVLYIDQENPERDIFRRGLQLGFQEDDDLFIFRPNQLNLNSDVFAKEFLDLIKSNNINVVFIDTFRAVAGGLKEDKAEEIRMFFNRFKILKDIGVVVVWLDHRRKPQNFEGKVPRKEQLLGSQDKTASVEILLLLSSDSGTNEIRVYQAKNRLDREIPAFKIIMEDMVDVGGNINTSLVYDGEIVVDETKKEEAREIILELLKEAGKTTEEITKECSRQKIGAKNTRSALKDLITEEVIDTVKKGRMNFYFLPDRKIEANETNDESDIYPIPII